MIHTQARVSGHMELILLDRSGTVMSRHENHNSIVPFGQSLLLSALRGETSTQRMEPFLGNAEFRTSAERGIESEGVVRLENIETLDPEQEGGRLAMGFRGTAAQSARVVGGGLAVFFRRGTSRAVQNGVYNFARTRSTVEVRAGMPLLLNFTLSVS